MEGKVVLITGASSGLGEAMAREFFDRGNQVILVARRKQELERIRNELLSNSKKCGSKTAVHIPIVLPIDLSKLDEINEKIQTILPVCNHRIDILVNNAGQSYRGRVIDTKLSVYEQIMQINYFAQVAITKAVLPSMIKNQSGQIVVISSIQGLMGLAERSAYSASKHAVQGFFDSLRIELARHEISVTVVSPGYINTNLSMNALTESGKRYGVHDETTASGFSAAYAAKEIVKRIERKKIEVILATLLPTLMVWVRRLFPALYFWIMIRRYLKK